LTNRPKWPIALLAPSSCVTDNATVESTHSALIVPIPEAEPVVAVHRDRLDRAAAWGVPAHVTVLYPFLVPADIDEHTIAVLRRLAAAVPAFFLKLTGIGWFDDRVVWLAPDPAEPFRALTAAVATHFPATQPYGGAFTDILPHLTMGHDHPATDLQAAAADVQAHLPIHARVTAVRLITGRPEPGGCWTPLADLPLG
jgi:2'-5' RNA ligase